MSTINGRGPGSSYVNIRRDAPGQVRQLIVDAYTESGGRGRTVSVTITEEALVEAVRGLGHRIMARSVADRLRELEPPVLFSVDMEDGLEEYVLTKTKDIYRTDVAVTQGFRIEHFDMPPESDLTIHYPTQN